MWQNESSDVVLGCGKINNIIVKIIYISNLIIVVLITSYLFHSLTFIFNYVIFNMHHGKVKLSVVIRARVETL